MRSDIYALGVLLFELLTGKTPFDPKELLSIGQDEMRRWNDRTHFFASAAEAMRRILVDNARRKRAARHGGGQQRMDMPELGSAVGSGNDRPPDGTQLVFAGNADTGSALWVVDVDADTGAVGEPWLLWDGGGSSYAPAWSPDGTKIAFSSLPESKLTILDLVSGQHGPGSCRFHGRFGFDLHDGDRQRHRDFALFGRSSSNVLCPTLNQRNRI